MSPATHETGKVGIVGAGPIGLIAALRLADAGVSTVLLDNKPGLVKQGSKACLIQGDVLEILDKAGCAGPIAQEGVAWTVARTYVRNKIMRSAEYPHGPGFGPFVNISQFRIEQVLAEAVEAHPMCDLRWGHEVTDVDQDAESVVVRAREADGTEHDLRFPYVVAADGVHSRMRELLDAEWTGYTHKDRFLITDIRAKLPLAKERHFHYDPSFNPGRQLVMHPQPDDIWRIDWQLPPDADIAAERADGRFDARVRAVIGDDVPYEVDWVSTYRFHQRVVARLLMGRVLFAGDAAHALPPYGSRGMNSGIQDADNLAWKLGAVLAGTAGEDLLETYHVERYAAAKENLRVTEATIRFMVPPNRLRRWTRAVLLALSHSVGAAGNRVNSGRMAEPYVYSDSPIVQPQDGDPMLGSFAPDGPVRVDGRPTRLRRLFGQGFVLLCTDGAPVDAVADAATSADVPVTVVAMGDAVSPGLTVVDADAETAARYRSGWWLVRPDGHLAAHGEHAADVPAALRRCLGAPDGSPDRSDVLVQEVQS